MPVGKTYAGMFRTTVLASAVLALFALPAVADQPQPRLLTVFGEGRASAAPDIAIVSLGVVSDAPNARDALAANAADMTAVVAAIKETGVEERDIATSGLTVEPVYTDPSKDPDGQSKITGYRVSNQVTIKIRDIAGSGPLLDKVIAAGANRVNGISFDIDKAESLRDDAVRAAIAEAKRRAALMAEAAGVRLGAIQSVNASDAGGGRPMFRAMAMQDSAAATPVLGGTQEIVANATLVYEIETK